MVVVGGIIGMGKGECENDSNRRVGDVIEKVRVDGNI